MQVLEILNFIYYCVLCKPLTKSIYKHRQLIKKEIVIIDVQLVLL